MDILSFLKYLHVYSSTAYRRLYPSPVEDLIQNPLQDIFPSIQVRSLLCRHSSVESGWKTCSTMRRPEESHLIGLVLQHLQYSILNVVFQTATGHLHQHQPWKPTSEDHTPLRLVLHARNVIRATLPLRI